MNDEGMNDEWMNDEWMNAQLQRGAGQGPSLRPAGFLAATTAQPLHGDCDAAALLRELREDARD
jgi:hypothetical protein